MAKKALKVSPDGQLYTSESDIQCTFVRRVEIVFPHLRPFLFSVPNGARLGGAMSKKGFPIAASILKAEGMTEGVSDLFFSYPRGGHSGLYIEMKTPIGKASVAQKEFLKRMTEVGYATAICKSADEAFETLRAYWNSDHEQLDLWTDKRFKK